MTRQSMFTTLLVMLIAVLAVSPALAQADTGNADFTTFVAIGDSLVAGEANASLTEVFQTSSHPLLIFRQVTGSKTGFEQPWISDPGIPGRLVLNPLTLTPEPLPGSGVPLNDGLARAYDNMGLVGGARVADLTSITGDDATCQNNPYTLAGLKTCSRMNLTLRDLGTAVDQAVSLNPTFVLLWVGDNDALQAATLGFLQVDLGGGQILPLLTPASAFETAYRAAVDQLTANGAQLALATVPNVSSAPLVNTIPWFLTNQQTRQPVLDGNGDMVPLIGLDATLTAPEALVAGDRVSLPAASLIAIGCGVNPLFDTEAGIVRDNVTCPPGTPLTQFVLRSADAATIEQTIGAYNDVIRAVAQEQDAALFDAKAVLDQAAADGVPIGGVEYTADFLTGGVFSYDGFHPAPVAQAIVANGFIQAINGTYNAHIPLVDLNPFVFGPDGGLAPPIPGPTRFGAELIEQIRATANLPTTEQLGAFTPVPSTPRARRSRRRELAKEDELEEPRNRRGRSRR